MSVAPQDTTNTTSGKMDIDISSTYANKQAVITSTSSSVIISSSTITTTSIGENGPTTITTTSLTSSTSATTKTSTTTSEITTSRTTSTTPTSTSTSTSSTPTSTSSLSTSTTVVTPSGEPPTTVVRTITTSPSQITSSSTSNSAAASTSSASAIGSTASGNGGSSGGVPANIVAPAVIVPIVGIALAVVLGLFFWRRRKQRLEAAEMRQKEMEEYSYNPNSDPTFPAVGAVSTSGAEGPGEGAGYRGWGTTSSAGPRTATTLAASTAGAIGLARSDSGGRGWDDHSSPHAISTDRDITSSPEGVGLLGAGPPTSSNSRNQGVNRGISNASSAYSGGQRSDESDNGPAGFAGSPQYYDEMMHHDEGINDGYGPPVIRDVSARRNTRIENPAIFPQHGNAGISQNF